MLKRRSNGKIGCSAMRPESPADDFQTIGLPVPAWWNAGNRMLKNVKNYFRIADTGKM